MKKRDEEPLAGNLMAMRVRLGEELLAALREGDLYEAYEKFGMLRVLLPRTFHCQGSAALIAWMNAGPRRKRSQKAVAAAIGVETAAVRELVRGTSMPCEPYLSRLEELTGIPREAWGKRPNLSAEPDDLVH